MRTQALTGDAAFSKWARRPELRYGLLGPVRLVPYAETEVAPSR